MLYNFSNTELFDVYVKEVRSILEYAVPVWHPGLTHKQSSEIEGVQKLVFKIILRQDYGNYSQACAYFNTVTLEERRLKLCLRFAKKNLQSENCLFTLPNQNINLRRRKQIVSEYKCNTSRFKRSSLPYLASLLNNESGT